MEKSKAAVIFAAVLGIVQAVSLFTAVGNEWFEWLTKNQIIILGVINALIGVVQTFAHKVPVKPAVVTGLFTGLALCLCLPGCARVKAALTGLPAFTVTTPHGDVITRDADGGTSITVAPIYIPAAQKSYYPEPAKQLGK